MTTVVRKNMQRYPTQPSNDRTESSWTKCERQQRRHDAIASSIRTPETRTLKKCEACVRLLLFLSSLRLCLSFHILVFPFL